MPKIFVEFHKIEGRVTVPEYRHKGGFNVGDSVFRDIYHITGGTCCVTVPFNKDNRDKIHLLLGNFGETPTSERSLFEIRGMSDGIQILSKEGIKFYVEQTPVVRQYGISAPVPQIDENAIVQRINVEQPDITEYLCAPDINLTIYVYGPDYSCESDESESCDEFNA